MRLIQTATLELHDFFNKKVPKYVVLSHTWGEDEISYNTYEKRMRPDALAMDSGSGATKIRACCVQAVKDGYKYAWIDTCCIDKSSSAELSESINSMYRWYEKSSRCYVYLADVRRSTEQQTLDDIAKSRWFTRGWTLQEFLAPDRVDFKDKDWKHILTIKRAHNAGAGKVSWFDRDSSSFVTRDTIVDMLTNTTKIGHRWITREWSIKDACVAEKLSWNAQRRTTRKEDEAYCLMGLFEVNMPLLYGEGSKAFKRLQIAIAQESSDHSLLAWGHRLYTHWNMPEQRGIFAVSASKFSHSYLQPLASIEAADMVWYPTTHYSVTNKGLHVTLPYLELPGTVDDGILVPLLCTSRDDNLSDHPRLLIAIPMYQSNYQSSIYARQGNFCKPVLVARDLFKNCPIKTMYLSLITERHSAPTWANRLPITTELNGCAWEPVLERSRTFVAEIYPPHIRFNQTASSLKIMLTSPDTRLSLEHDLSLFAMHLANPNPRTTGAGAIFLFIWYAVTQVDSELKVVRPKSLRIGFISEHEHPSLMSFVLHNWDTLPYELDCTNHIDAKLFNDNFDTGEIHCVNTGQSAGEVELTFLYKPEQTI